MSIIGNIITNLGAAIKGRGNRAGNPGEHAPAAKVNGKKANERGIRRGTLSDGREYCDAQVRVKGFLWNGKKSLAKRFFGKTAFADAQLWKLTEEKAARAVLAQGPQLPTDGLPLTSLLVDALETYMTLRSAKTNDPLKNHELLLYRALQKHALLKCLRVNQLTAENLLAYFRDRGVRQKLAASTCLKEWIHLRKALRTLAAEYRGTWGAFDPCNEDVRKRLKKEKLIGESHEKIRVAEEHELVQLRAYFLNDAGMLAVIEFANVNGFRRGEIERAEWSDFNEVNRTLRAWRKDSKSKGGRRLCWVPLLPEAVEIIKAQPRVADRIFPTYTGDQISGKFTDACRELGINPEGTPDEDVLTFHDLRHTALTRLAENMGELQIGIPELKLISGHKSSKHLDRYINFKDRHAAKVSTKLLDFRAIPTQPVPVGNVVSIAA